MEPGQDDQRGPKNYAGVLLEAVARGDAPAQVPIEASSSGSRGPEAVGSAQPGLVNLGPEFYEKYKSDIENAQSPSTTKAKQKTSRGRVAPQTSYQGSASAEGSRSLTPRRRRRDEDVNTVHDGDEALAGSADLLELPPTSRRRGDGDFPAVERIDETGSPGVARRMREEGVREVSAENSVQVENEENLLDYAVLYGHHMQASLRFRPLLRCGL